MERIVNGKALSLKHYLNKDLGPSEDENGEPTLYDLYTRVIYDRQVTRFKAKLFFHDSLTKKDAGEFLVPEDYEEEEDLIRYLKVGPDYELITDYVLNIFEYELKKEGIPKKLKGLSKKLFYYYLSLDNFLERKYRARLFAFLGDHLPFNIYNKYHESKSTFLNVIEILKLEHTETYFKVPEHILRGVDYVGYSKYLNQDRGYEKILVYDVVIKNYFSSSEFKRDQGLANEVFWNDIKVFDFDNDFKKFLKMMVEAVDTALYWHP